MEGQVILHTEGCLEVFACASGREIWLLGSWMNIADDDKESIRNARREVRDALMHELGHVFDTYRLTDKNRNRISRLLRTKRPWRGIEGSDVVPVQETFADAYMYCARRKPVNWYVDGGGEYLYEPSPKTHRKICRYIRSL